MLFMYIHTHTLDKCIADKPEQTEKFLAEVRASEKRGVIKLIGLWAAPHEHTNYCVFEATDLAATEKALLPMTLWGNARLIPILSAEQISGIGRK